MINYNRKAVFVLVLLAYLLMACGVKPPSPICGTPFYHTKAVDAVNTSAKLYVDYTMGTLSYKSSLVLAQQVDFEFRALNCPGDEHAILMNILKSTWFAIEAHEKSGFSIANIYIEKAFRGINVLNTYYGWRI